MSKNILEIQNLTKYYGKIKGVENLSLKLEEGEIFGFDSWEQGITTKKQK